MSVTSSSTNSSSGIKPRVKTNWQTSIDIAYSKGKILCNDETHFMRFWPKTNPPARFPEPKVKPVKKILELMEPYKKAKCDCERNAIKEAWGYRHPGQLQQNFVAYGSWYKGVGKYDPSFPGKKVMPTPFRLTTAQSDELRARFPDWMFVQTSSNGHDHPVSHCTTMIATYEMMDALPSGTTANPTYYLDLHGNPKASARHNSDKKKIITVVNLESPKDYLRQYTKWGPQYNEDDKEKKNPNYIICGLRDLPSKFPEIVSKVDCVLSFHTLYYYDEPEICNLLRATRGKIMRAVMHRHRSLSGHLNNNELSWVKAPFSDKGDKLWVTQTNVNTGEVYYHPDGEKWFQNSTWSPHKTFEQAVQAGDTEDTLTWTSNMTCEGTYNHTIAVVPARVLTLDAKRFDESDKIKPTDTSTATIARTNQVHFNILGEPHVITLNTEHHTLFKQCRNKIVNLPRNAETYRSHVNFVKVQVASVLKNKVDVSPEQLRDIALSSFWIDFDVDVAAHSNQNVFAKAIANTHNALMAGKSNLAPETMIKTLLDVALIALDGKDVKDVARRGILLAKNSC